MDQELFARFRKCAVEVLSVDESAVTESARFKDDLDADSLDLVELVMALEEQLDISVPEEDLEGVVGHWRCLSFLCQWPMPSPPSTGSTAPVM